MLFKSIITLTLLTSVLALPTPQLAGEGQFFDAIFTDTDNGVGYGIENAENNLAATISGTKTNPTGGSGSTGGGNPPPPPPPGPHRRQLDKISNGFQTLSSSLGAGDSTKQMTDTLDSVDGTLTSDAANLGQNVGGTEESFLEGMGNAVPRV